MIERFSGSGVLRYELLYLTLAREQANGNRLDIIHHNLIKLV